MVILDKLLKGYDEGRSKSFFCLAAALMEIDDLREAMSQARDIRVNSTDIKQLAKQVKGMLILKAGSKGIELVYRREKASHESTRGCVADRKNGK